MIQPTTPRHNAAEVIRNRFFYTLIPTGDRRATSKCFAAGQALLAFLQLHGVAVKLFRRDEYPFRLADWTRTAEIVNELARACQALPAVPGAEPRRDKAVAALRDYARTLTPIR